MVASSRDLFIEQGATFTFGFQWVRETSENVYDPVNITGYKIRMQIREKHGSPVLISATTENNFFVIVTPTEGRVRLTLPAVETDKLTKTPLKYDIEMVSPAGDVFRVLQGNVKVSPNITQDEPAPPSGG